MLRTLTLMILSLSAMAADGDCALELSAFGVSYHTNRNFNWNERNWGGGVGIRMVGEGQLELRLAAARYKDSMNEKATVAMGGFGYLFGNRNNLHASLEFNLGYMNGSGISKGVNAIPVLAVGYGPVDLCFTGMIMRDGLKHETTGPDDLEHAQSSVIGAFVRFTVLKW